MASSAPQWASSLGGWYNTNTNTIILIGLLVLALRFIFRSSGGDGEPPKLGERIPFLSNTIEFTTNPEAFYKRALKTMQSLNTEMLRFRIAGRRAYLVMGDAKTNPLFRASSGLTARRFIRIFTDVMFGPTDKDSARFAADISGRAREPVPGTEHVTDRLWVKWHRILSEYISHPTRTSELTRWYFDRFTARIAELYPLGKPTDMLVWKFLQHHQTECAGRAMCGDLVFDTTPDYLDGLFGYELALLPVGFGPPRWLNPKPHRARDRWLAMNRRYMAQALQDYDWTAAPVDDGWDPVFGSPFMRQLVRWGLDAGLDVQTIAGMCGQQMSNLNSNSVPATAWCIMNALTCSDPDLLPNLRREAEAALLPGGDADSLFDMPKLLSSPWLQAVYTETLRLRVSFSIVREAERATTLDGFTIPNGAMVQAPIPLAHYNEGVWGVKGHPADEFWPRRHLQLVGDEDKETKKGKFTFSISSQRSGYFFPYGGGITMCPGRNFAKQEIIGTLALFLTWFDVEVVGWVMPDGERPSDREARNGETFALCRPDRDLKLRVTRKR
ncbi:cytochrome P450 [Cercophora newfieldiana]|uniref:Cytochrome P450 n=1 Tax=Cercophora newfieldiana TaxID=92897 RepID=A0AA40D074_9PEZI|nr:cytochrome P450 [Cercophora newfieldiana]